MHNSSIDEILTIGLDVILFIFSLTLIVTLSAQGNDIANKLKQQVGDNETVTVVEHEIPTSGYYSDGELKYDGIYEGEEVFFTIISLKDVVVKIKTENTEINLNTSIYQNRVLLEYIQYEDTKYLSRYVDINKQYTKEYVINAHGKIAEVIFKEVQ